jgi:hypothetical protein
VYTMALIARLYGEKDCTHFKDAGYHWHTQWLPPVICSIGNYSFHSLNRMIERVQKAKPKQGWYPFYMASYLMDVICATNVFLGVNLSGHISESPVHVYCQVLWENKYKRHYAMICDQFLAPLYQLIFCKECPRLTKEAMKLIRYIESWYL